MLENKMTTTNRLTLCAILGLMWVSCVSHAQKYGYNGRAAAVYAERYCTSYNNKFNSYPNTDCANFVSQSILAGLIGNSDGNTVFANTSRFTADRGSYYAWYAYTSAWINAQSLRQYAQGNLASYKGLHMGFVTEDTSSAYLDVNRVQVGDVIFADWDNNGTMDHVMLVTEIWPVQGYNRIRYAAHTLNAKNAGLGDLNVYYRYKATFHVFRPLDYNFSGR
jgi:hypothetical protein